MTATIIKRVLVPVLLLGSMFSPLAGDYEEGLLTAVCIAAMVALMLAVHSRDYFMAGGTCLITIVFSPLSLPYKIFALLSFACVVILVALHFSWKHRTLTPAP
jgi:hypothetical protein